ncbi:MAG: hypothetical protein D6770_09415 [Anaerolineae bacterium]|nr:MAG: hypothetical protein D6770_09415 [Anaerolineae bacterium]
MPREWKYLGLGMLIGAGIALPLFAGMFLLAPSLSLTPPTPRSGATRSLVTPAPASRVTPQAVTAFPSPTPTVTPTFTPTPTAIAGARRSAVSAFATSTPLNPADLTEPLIIGPLTKEQQERLYRVSLRYRAPTVEESIPLAKEINGVGYGHPSNICGPLAISILRDAGLVGADVRPYDFWLLNPGVPEDRRILERTFPPERFLHFETKEPLYRIDWRSFPLKPGDFLYIKSGTGGNFDHMLVVTRVDEEGRAYSVTNYATTEGFIIDEVMLYDPDDPTAGIFRTWTEHPYAMLGATGFGGFELWRPQVCRYCP